MTARRHGPRRLALAVVIVTALAVVIAAAGFGVYVFAVASTVSKLSGRRAIVSGASSQVFASGGQRLGFIQSDVLRTPVPRAQTPRALREATVSIEDQRFYRNDGIDLTGIFRSAARDAVTGATIQGASTITMQLVRNLYLGNDLKTFKQKIAEAKLAIEYNKVHSKPEILNEYLNTVAYGTLGGQTALGVEAASRMFFDKPVNKLDLEQCALLAGLPQAPSQYNPFLYPKAAMQRRNEVLHKMAELHYISKARAKAVKAMPLQLKRGYYYQRRRENYFFEYVRELLTKKYGKKTVDRGGLRVYTTLNLHMQQLARKAITDVLDEPGDPASAIVTMNPRNGYIETMAQSETYAQSQYNLAVQGHRQAGSTFKAIDLAEALSRGIDPETTYYVSHTLLPGWLPSYPTYEVKTFEDTSLNAPLNLVSATLSSDNTVYAQLAVDLGEETITQMAYKMGVHAKLHSYPSEALGGLTVGVSPLEMADVYATLADNGWRNKPIAITKVVFPNGKVDRSWGKPHRVKVLSDGVTSEETKILEENVLGGTATRSEISCPTAAKTGTTNELIDAWLDGYTPEYSTVVWMGYPSKRVPMYDVHGEAQQGGALPANIWHDYMEPVVKGKCVPWATPTESLTYKPFYGKFASEGSASEQAASEPTEIIGKHKHHKPGEEEAQGPQAGGPHPEQGAEAPEAGVEEETGGIEPGATPEQPSPPASPPPGEAEAGGQAGPRGAPAR